MCGDVYKISAMHNVSTVERSEWDEIEADVLKNKAETRAFERDGPQGR